MRKMMTKEVTFTTLKIAKLEVKEGKPEIVNLPNEIVLGTISPEKAQKLVNKKHNTVVTILEHKVEDKTYEMAVEDFIKVAKVVGEPTPEPTPEPEPEEKTEPEKEDKKSA